MEIIKKPDSLSLLGNIKTFEISTSSLLQFKLYHGDVLLLNEQYQPTAVGLVSIDIKDVLESNLHFNLPTSHIFRQNSILGNFKAIIDTTQILFSVIRSGVENYLGPAATFLESNFLTWQPQELKINAEQPCWLTYYNPKSTAVYFKIKFYTLDGTVKVINYTTIAAEECMTLNMQFAYIYYLPEVAGINKQGYYDTWIENAAGERLTYEQRFIYSSAGEDDVYFLFENSLGGIDSFVCNGENSFSPEIKYTTASYDEKSCNTPNELTRRYIQNTGYKTDREALWLWDFFKSSKRYKVENGTIIEIFLFEGEIEESNQNSLHAFNFTYSFSSDDGLLSIPRATSLPELLEIKTPESLFFLAPRLAEFPLVVLDDSTLFPVQSPFSETWQQINWGAIKEYIFLVVNAGINPFGHFHSNKLVLDKLSLSETGKLLFDGAEIAGGSGGGEVGKHTHPIRDINGLPEALDKKFDKSNLLTTTSETLESEENAYTASRSKAEDEKRLRKDVADTATEMITFNKGLTAYSTAAPSDVDNGIIEPIEKEESPAASFGVSEAASDTTLGTLGNVDSAADSAVLGSLFVRGATNWETVTPEYTPIEKDPLIPAFDNVLKKWVFTKISSGSPAGSGIKEEYLHIYPFTGNILVDFLKTPFSKVSLEGSDVIFSLQIKNTQSGDTGRILVYQSGFKQVALTPGLEGSINLPLNKGTIALLTYKNIEGKVYLYTDTIVGDEIFPVPSTITDFISTYSDNTTCKVIWTAPQANNIYDTPTYYEMKFSNTPVNADESGVWESLLSIKDLPVPGKPGELEKFTISGLIPNKQYYVYLKSVKVNYGIRYRSKASNPIYFKTVGVEDLTKPYRLPLTKDNLFLPYEGFNILNGVKSDGRYMVDEADKNVFLETGYPDTKNKDFTTKCSPNQYGRTNYPYFFFIDLNSVCVLDKLFLYSSGKGAYNIYIQEDMTSKPEFLGVINLPYDTYGVLDCLSKRVRYVIFALENFKYASVNSCNSLLNPDTDWNIASVDNLLVYGRTGSNIPLNITPPRRRAVIQKTVEEFICMNGHGYMSPRPHSLISGKNLRLYSDAVRYMDEHASYIDEGGEISPMPATISAGRFIFDSIGWYYYNSPNLTTGDGMMKSFKDFGFDLFLVTLGNFSVCEYYRPVKTGANSFERKYPDTRGWMVNNYKTKNIDDYFLPGVTRPTMTLNENGASFYEISRNPQKYKLFAKFIYNLMARYGSNSQVPDSSLSLLPAGKSSGLTEPLRKGLNVIGGIEYDNETAGDWLGRCKFTDPYEYAAIISAAYDGHCGELYDEDGNQFFGFKGICPDKLSILTSLPNISYAFIYQAILWWKSNRKDGSVPFDVINYHHYCTNAGGQSGTGGGDILYSIAPESDTYLQENLSKAIEFRDKYFPDKQVWLTEWGYGESGNKNKDHKFSVDSLPGKIVSGVTVPDRHKSEIKGAWGIRGMIHMMSLGLDQVNWFSTFSDCWNFHDGMGEGAGYEVYEFDKCTDTAPGEKYRAALSSEATSAQNGFTSLGLFAGAYIGNGGYPISKAFWMIATFRNRFKGYRFIGFTSTEHAHLKIACFKKNDENKGAYAVYLSSSTNDVLIQANIPIPASLTIVTKVTNYIPILPDPRNIPQEQINTPPANYYPIIGPVGQWCNLSNSYLRANQKVNPDGSIRTNAQWAHDQVNALCDYIEDNPEGIKGLRGLEAALNVSGGSFKDNIFEIPQYYFFEAIPEPDFNVKVQSLSAQGLGSSIIELVWNNTSVEDTGYEIFISSLPDSGYILYKSVDMSVNNRVKLTGLSEDTGYYFKVRPISGNRIGELSDYAFARTNKGIAAPVELVSPSQTAATITLSWVYVAEQPADFVAYCIYREAGGQFLLIGQVEDFSKRTFTDSGLASSQMYTYKVCVTGINSRSEFSNVLLIRTKLPQECSPTPVHSITDKLGTKIYVDFDLPLSTFNLFGSAGFSLKQDGIAVMITAVERDASNTKRVVLTIPTGSLADYSLNKVVRLSYSGTEITSEYGIKLDSFSDLKVNVVIGNFSNLRAIYNVNVSQLTEVIEGWNNLHCEEVKTGTAKINLVDTYGRTSNIFIEKNKDWEEAGITDSACSLDVPEAVKKSYWRVNYFAVNTENTKGGLLLSGLDNNNKYTLKVFGGKKYGDSDVKASVKVNEIKSNIVQQYLNESTFMALEDISPIDSKIQLDIISETVKSGLSPYVMFLHIEEYLPAESEDNNQIYLRSLTIPEGNSQGVTFVPDVNIIFNCVGTASQYRVSLNEAFIGSAWMDLVEGKGVFHFDNYASHTLYLQVRNSYYESNVITATLEYRQWPVENPVVLGGISINSGAADTMSRSVQVTFTYTSESEDIEYCVYESEDNKTWLVLSGNVVSYTLSEPLGVKTLYAQLRKSGSVSEIRSAMIELKPELPVQSGLKAIVWPTGAWDNRGLDAITKISKTYIGYDYFDSNTGEVLGQLRYGSDNSTQISANNSYTPVGEWPEWVYKQYVTANSSTPGATVHFILSIKNGKYRIKLFGSSHQPETQYPERCFFEVQGTVKNPSQPLYHNDTYKVVWELVSVTDGILNVKLWHSDSWGRTPLQIIEIEEVL